ncbi:MULTISPECIES: NfeD family protein [unclassified Devosia]|uniref:NfeD family protein n=1 Tax=unclassified Devosia TaxID=196773 RepID=UPI00145CE906|nr:MULTISPECIES: NfeD family protein [unclassified Devosia]MBJ6988525.1 NfeD family protein [Devosia sp. MC521]QMW62669.1 NfeD family protein [Devosia sp. MC521]
MNLIALIASFGPWSWMVFGLILLGLELAVPGGFLIWFGVSALVIGALTLVVAVSWPLQWLAFAALSLSAIFIWTKSAKRRQAHSDKPLLNQRTDQLIGQTGILSEPIISGLGRMHIGDTVWRVSGPDLTTGSKVRVVGADGNILRVEPF